jgi:single-strand DNA-binding protein
MEALIMRNFNLAVLEGRLVSDPETRQTQNGTTLCTFSIASNYSYYREDELQEEVYFLDVTAWTKLAELCGEYLKKGSRVLVNGRIRQRKWQDEEGATHSRISIVAQQVQFLDFPEGDGQKEGRDYIKEEDLKDKVAISDDSPPF